MSRPHRRVVFDRIALRLEPRPRGAGAGHRRNGHVCAAVWLLLFSVAATAGARPVVTVSAGPSTTPTVTPSRSATQTPTINPSPTSTAVSPTRTATFVSPTRTPTPVSPTSTRTGTVTGTPTLTPTPATPTRTRTGSGTPTASSTPTPTYSPSVTDTPSYTYTPTYTYTRTRTRTPSSTPTCYYEGFCTPTDTPTLTPSHTPTVTPTPTPGCQIQVSKEGGYPALLANRNGSGGGIGNFRVTSSGLQEGETFTLKITAVSGTGSATFVANGGTSMTLTGNVDQIVKLRGGETSSEALNMELQAYCPDGKLVSKTKFTVFWTVGMGVFAGPVPDDAIGPAGRLSQWVERFRQDRKNELGWTDLGWADETRTRGAARGNMLAKFQVQPDGIPPGDLRKGGPDDGFDTYRLRTGRYYLDGCVYNSSITGTDVRESSAAVAKDLTADPETSGSSRLVIYDWDAPSLPKRFPSELPFPRFNHDYRVRVNFRAWSLYTDDDGNQRPASAFFDWYFRSAWHYDGRTGNTTAQGAPGDNQVAAGKTALTWNLDPSTEKEMKITAITPTEAGSFEKDKVTTIDIDGSFPANADGSCHWVVYFLSTPGDTSGDPRDVPEDIVFFADNVQRVDENHLKADIHLNVADGSQPQPSGTYKIHVVHGDKDVKGPDFEVTERPLAFWKFFFAQAGNTIKVGVRGFDGLGNRVSRRGKPRPTMFKASGSVGITGFTVTGKYGEYIGTTTRVPPGATGTLVVGVKGVPPEPINYETFTIK